MDRPRFIRCISPFPGGTKLPCEEGRSYHFLPNVYGHYVAEVLRDDDYEKILSIGRGYQPYTPEDAKLGAEQAEEKVEADRATSETTAETIESDTAQRRASMSAEADAERARIARNREQLARARAARGQKAAAE